MRSKEAGRGKGGGVEIRVRRESRELFHDSSKLVLSFRRRGFPGEFESQFQQLFLHKSLSATG